MTDKKRPVRGLVKVLGKYISHFCYKKWDGATYIYTQCGAGFLPVNQAGQP